jgi:hypothetical protein
MEARSGCEIVRAAGLSQRPPTRKIHQRQESKQNIHFFKGAWKFHYARVPRASLLRKYVLSAKSIEIKFLQKVVNFD